MTPQESLQQNKNTIICQTQMLVNKVEQLSVSVKTGDSEKLGNKLRDAEDIIADIRRLVWGKVK
jgi:hypothetical protein